MSLCSREKISLSFAWFSSDRAWLEDDLLKGNNRVECLYLPRSWLPESEKGFVQVQEGFHG
jgi:hypothetical protein